MVHGLETIHRLNREVYERDIDPQPDKRVLTIAIDYDDTFTADPTAWIAVIGVLTGLGHKVICVTSRRHTFDNELVLRSALNHSVERILFAYDMPKRAYAKQHGWEVDIWIDDRPETIATKEECLSLVG